MTATVPIDGQTLSVTELAALSIDARFTQMADALEKIASLDDLIDRLTVATERQADAIETLTGLFASVIGVGTTTCDPNGSPKYEAVNFLRSGTGAKDFACDGDSIEVAKDD